MKKKIKLNEVKAIVNQLIRESANDDIAKSLWSLAKSNGGLFKSESQKNFLERNVNEYPLHIGGGGEMYGNGFNYTFTLDDLGVVSIEKRMFNSGKSVIMFERPTDRGEIDNLINTQQSQKNEKNEIINFQKESQDLIEKYNKIKNNFDSEQEILVEKFMNKEIEFEEFSKELEIIMNKKKNIDNQISYLIILTGAFNRRDEIKEPNDEVKELLDKRNIIYSRTGK